MYVGTFFSHALTAPDSRLYNRRVFCFVFNIYSLALISLSGVLCTEVPLQIDHRVSHDIRRYSFTFREISVCDY